MKALSKNVRAAAAVVAAVVALAGCSGSAGGPGASGNSFSMQITAPSDPLIPGATTSSNGIQILETVFVGLVQYHPVTTDAEYSGVAKLIETGDNVTFKITLHDHWRFHDGTPVTADSFINAWNYVAASKNGMGNAFAFRNIEGFDDLQAPEGGQAATDKMSGLKKVDDHSFTVQLSKPFAQWPLATGFLAFAPLPEAFFDDPEGFAENPIGNGPWQVAQPLDPNTGIVLKKYDDYAGPNKARTDQLEYRFYTDENSSYLETQSDSLDISRVPTSAVSSAKTLFGDRYVQRQSGVFTFLGFPLYDERFKDKRVRQAFSMAIDREAITDAIFDGTRTPARSVVSPMIAGARLDACQTCTLDVEQAKELLEDANFDTSEPVELLFSGGAGHDAWVTAVGNQLKTNLGVTYRLDGAMQDAEYWQTLESKGAQGPFRMGWGMDYPSAQNYLEPLFSVAAQPPSGSNLAYYDNPDFEKELRNAEASRNNEEAISHYQVAEDIVLEDMPVIPLFFGLAQYVHSRDVKNVKINAFERVVTTDVELVE